MVCNEKVKQYNSLVDDINGCSNENECGMTLCKDCKEVNLWTYWEGGRDRLDADILVVGQDWGHIENPGKVSDVLKEVGDATGGFGYNNMIDDPGKATNETLFKLCSIITGNQDIENDYYKLGRKCNNVFFTNYVCCYRKGNTSGKFNSTWAKNCKFYFQRLVKIIEPNVIICLGRKTFDCVSEAAGLPRSRGAYNEVICNGAVTMTFGDVCSKVYPMAHPGLMGTLNRCPTNDKNQKRGFELQCEDWSKIKLT